MKTQNEESQAVVPNQKYLIHIEPDYFFRVIHDFESLSQAQKNEEVRKELESIVKALEGDENFVFVPGEFIINRNNSDIKIYPLESGDALRIELQKPSFNAELILTLESKNDWIKRVPNHLPEKKYYNEQFIWIDANGNTLVMGEDFEAAERMASYPVKVYRHIRVSDAEKTVKQSKE